MAGNVKFIRKNGRVIPIREKVAGGVAVAGAGAAAYGVGKQVLNIAGSAVFTAKAIQAHRAFGPNSKNYAANKKLAQETMKSAIKGRRIMIAGAAVAAAGGAALIGMKLMRKK